MSLDTGGLVIQRQGSLVLRLPTGKQEAYLAKKRVVVWRILSVMGDEAVLESGHDGTTGKTLISDVISLESAYEYFTQAIKAQPGRVEFLALRSVASNQEGLAGDALRDLSDAIAIEPSAELYLMRASVRDEAGERELCLSDARKAIELAPQLTDAYVLVADIHRRSGEIKKAIGILSELLSRLPEDGMARRYRARLYAENTDYLKALLDYNALCDKGLVAADVYLERGNVYLSLGENAQAVNDFSSAVALQPHDVSAIGNLALAYYRIGKLTAALESAEKALRIDPDEPHSLNVKGLALHDSGRYRDAIGVFSKGLKSHPNFTDLLINRASSHLALSEPRKAMNDAHKATELSPNAARARCAFGDAALMSSLFVEARDAFNEAIRLSPTSDLYEVRLGYTLLLLDDPRAAEHARKAIEKSRIHAGENRCEVNLFAAGIIGYISSMSDGRRGEAVRVAASAGDAISADPLMRANMRYLAGNLERRDLVNLAASPDELLVALTVIAARELFEGSVTDSLEHLEWVKKHTTNEDNYDIIPILDVLNRLAQKRSQGRLGADRED